MRETLTLKKDVPVAGDYDVVVCGGGPAGLMAAISAARAGQRTALIERMESRHGIHTEEAAAELGLGSREYTLVNLD